jgi:hypothetical protein
MPAPRIEEPSIDEITAAVSALLAEPTIDSVSGALETSQSDLSTTYAISVQNGSPRPLDPPDTWSLIASADTDELEDAANVMRRIEAEMASAERLAGEWIMPMGRVEAHHFTGFIWFFWALRS